MCVYTIKFYPLLNPSIMVGLVSLGSLGGIHSESHFDDHWDYRWAYRPLAAHPFGGILQIQWIFVPNLSN